MAAILAFLTSKAGLAGIAVVLVLGVFGVMDVRMHLALDGERKAKATLAAEHDAEQAREVRAAAISAQSASELSKTRVEIQTRTVTLTRKVPVYVPASADAECVVPRGFVQLHDAAAQGLSTPSGGPDPAASGVPLSAVAETVVGNYGTALQWRAEALSWRDWYVKQAGEWNVKP